MNEYTTYVGMDAHARSITCKGLDVTTGERFDKTFVDCPSAEVLYGWLKDLPQPRPSASIYCAKCGRARSARRRPLYAKHPAWMLPGREHESRCVAYLVTQD